jgi:hypothetical protein
MDIAPRHPWMYWISMDYPLDTGCGCGPRIHGCGCDQHPWISIQCHHCKIAKAQAVPKALAQSANWNSKKKSNVSPPYARATEITCNFLLETERHGFKSRRSRWRQEIRRSKKSCRETMRSGSIVLYSDVRTICVTKVGVLVSLLRVVLLTMTALYMRCVALEMRQQKLMALSGMSGVNYN